MKTVFSQSLAALFCGAVFGFGLSLSGMLDPMRVQGFLDIFGAWDPSLIFVLGGAVVVAFIGMVFVRRMREPVLAASFNMPTKRTIDLPLVAGSALFGIGWGLGGFCPGPALAALPLGFGLSVVFVVAMVIGMIVHDRFVAGRL
ncbi:YeeE/YedE family protein [Allorhizobium sp. BGMRC 0089]|uniref:YeeE/YedE family protein n=1 Tax=Allorhizobium sonneratiae TaxID=2934936 RepID=UPI002034048F|nr:YeeE/YedE family protein [Allorhizobium sonneratiae]MCM2292088.1 YeeE/YedE family protein [Allorhizobium sonneratiae]